MNQTRPPRRPEAAPLPPDYSRGRRDRGDPPVVVKPAVSPRIVRGMKIGLLLTVTPVSVANLLMLGSVWDVQGDSADEMAMGIMVCLSIAAVMIAWLFPNGDGDD